MSESACTTSRVCPICRSITGDGVRETLRVIGEVLPALTSPTSRPDEASWTMSARVNFARGVDQGPVGRKVVDFEANDHVMGYSVPVRALARPVSRV